MKAVVWSKESCSFCVSAKQLLKQKGYDIEERVIGHGFTREQLIEAVPLARTVPQIFVDGKYVGGYDDLKLYFANKTVKTSVQQQWDIKFPASE